MTTKLSPDEARALGVLMEKAATTPENYPLSANALRVACNQTTNRDPVIELDQRTVDNVMIELRQRGLARTVNQAGSRVAKHKHIADDALGLTPSELAVLAVLLLRGPQTVAELASRAARYAGGPTGPADVEAVIDRLHNGAEPLVERLGRRPGEREPRVDQLIADRYPTATDGSAIDDASASTASTSRADAAAPLGSAPIDEALEQRVAALERALAEQAARIDRLAEALGDW